MLRPTPIAALLSLLMVVACLPPAWAGPTVTAANRATAPTDANTAAVVEITGSPEEQFDRQLAQTFLAETTGTLKRVAVTAGARAGAAQNDGLGLRMSIASFDPQTGQISEMLSSAPVEEVETLPGFGGPFSQPDVLQALADFESARIELRAGSSYAMIFSAERFGDSFFILGGTLPDYEKGLIAGRLNDEPFLFRPITDLFFEVTVSTVPEPSTLLMAFAPLALGVYRRRNISWRPLAEKR